MWTAIGNGKQWNSFEATLLPRAAAQCLGECNAFLQRHMTCSEPQEQGRGGRKASNQPSAPQRPTGFTCQLLQDPEVLVSTIDA